MMRRLVVCAVATMMWAVAAAPASAAEWIDPELRADGPAILLGPAQVEPGGWLDEWFTHAELRWLGNHGLTPSALAVLARRMTPPPPPPVTHVSPRAAARPVTRPVAAPPASVEGWRGLVAAYFSPDHVDRALRIIYCESRGDPGATNARSGAAGLFQHLPRYWEQRSAAAGWGGADIYNPEANVAVAAWLVYSGGGWGHWRSCA